MSLPESPERVYYSSILGPFDRVHARPEQIEMDRFSTTAANVERQAGRRLSFAPINVESKRRTKGRRSSKAQTTRQLLWSNFLLSIPLLSYIFLGFLILVVVVIVVVKWIIDRKIPKTL
jgi:hypothetical protein